MKSTAGLFGVMLAAYSLLSQAALPHAPTEAELARLPPFCAVRFGRQGPDFQSQLGRQNWIHIHHYCHGLKFVMRAQNYPKERRAYLNQARGEYEYVLHRVEPTFWLRPQMNVEMARIYLQLKERSLAQSRLSDAIRLNPRFEPAYVLLLGILAEDGARSAALDVATQGLRHLPASEPLKKAYLDNGGSRPFPEPMQAGTTPTSAPEPAASSAETGETPPAAVDQAAAQAVQQGEAATSAEGAAGSACRFCPPSEIQERWRESFQGEK